MNNDLEAGVPDLFLKAARQEILGLGANPLPDLSLGVEEGVQVWNSTGLVYANPAAGRHFGFHFSKTFDAESWILARCSDHNRAPLTREGFPAFQVLQSAEPCSNTVLWVELETPVCLKVNAYPIFAEDGTVGGVLSISHEITELIKEGKRLEAAAHYDSLTGLPNRLLLIDRMQVAMAHSRRSGQPMTVCMLDLDGFKQVNDSLGHASGDLLLKEVALRLQGILREEDTAARLGGDEFVLLICGLQNDSDSLHVIDRILRVINAPYIIREEVVRISASIGVTLYPSDNAVADQLLRHADQAMYQAKTAGKNRYHLFNPAVESRIRANRATVEGIVEALRNEQFVLQYQPIVDCEQAKVVAMEALVSWQHPVSGLRAPAEFLPLIEHEDMIVDLGEWVIDKALQHLMEWRKQGLDLKVSVNVATRQLLRGDFNDRMTHLLSPYPEQLVSRLELELLETAALEDVKTIGTLIEAQQARGISFALDDFGNGFSSLGHLKHLRANSLKIDRRFVHDMVNDPGDLVVVQGIIGLGKAFSKTVVAEGVETIEQIQVLMELGCRLMQGFGIARPMSADKVPGWVGRFSPDPRWRVVNCSYPGRSDFDLLLMEVSHRQWISQLQASLQEPVDQRKRPKSAEECLISNWIANSEQSRCGDLSNISMIDTLHRDLHGIAERLWKINATQQADEYAELEQSLLAVSEKLLTALRTARENLISA